MGKHVRLHHQPRLQFQKPAAAVTPSCFHEIQWPVILGAPVVLFNASHRRIHHYHASRPEDGRHAPVGQADVAIAIPHRFSLFHPRKAPHVSRLLGPQPCVIRPYLGASLRVHRKTDGKLMQVGVRRGKCSPVFKRLLEGRLIPSRDFQWVQMVNGRQGISFVKAGHYISVFDVRKPADVQDEVRPATLGRDLITGLFYLPISQPKHFPCPA